MKRLIVVVPGIAGGFRSWKDLLARLKSEPDLAGAQWLEWHHGLGVLTTRRCAAAALELRARIDEEWKHSGPFDSVCLIGHSIGGLIVRSAFIQALDSAADSTRSKWVGSVDRMVLFAAINRGVNGLNEPGDRGLLRVRIAFWLFRMFPVLQRLTMYDSMRGSDFVTDLRIRWIRHFQAAQGPQPVVVQLLGTRDTVVTRNDSLDLEQFPNAWHVDIPGASHGNLHELETAPDPDRRYSTIRDALLSPVPPGENRTITGSKHLVFVLHGIRANNYTWVDELKSKLSSLGLEPVTPSYGFFSALKFTLPAARRRHLHWLQDQYADRVACNPSVRCDFVGHSNGTYLFGHSLLKVPGIKFNRAILIGSVLPADYPWRERFDTGQVETVTNLRANRDFPVSILCSALRGLGMRDVGTGGFEGFRQSLKELKEVFWYEGGHSAALESCHLDSIVQLISAQPAPGTETPQLTKRLEKHYMLGMRLAPWIARLALLALLAGVVWFVFLAAGFSPARLVVALVALMAIAIALDTV